MNSKRETWVDDVKTVACILVVLGHFYQSMVKSSILPNSGFYEWFNSTIYLFHVQLFFLCSGYLYQKYSVIRTAKTWGKNVLKKLMVLGIPYAVFSFATWILKKMFEGSVNGKVGSLPNALFVEPIAPYWYLYVLFFIFVITFTVQKKSEIYCLLIIAFVLKVIPFFGVKTGVYLVGKIMANWFWFVLGMALAYGVVGHVKMFFGIIVGVIFIVSSVLYHMFSKSFSWIDFALGLMACFAVVCVVRGINDRNGKQIFKSLSKYTMPIFLMHTLFAAPVRVVMNTIGIRNVIIHVLVGLAVTIAGPIIAMIIMEKLHPLDFIVYPGRYLKKEKRN